jgi:hypothetical protein
MTGNDVEVRIVAAMVLLRIARQSREPAAVVHWLQSARTEIADAIQLMAANVTEQPLLRTTVAAPPANGNGKD